MNSVFKATIKQFRESYPDVSLSLVELPTHEQPRALADKRIHAGFMHFGPGRTLLRKKRNEGESSQDDTVLDWINIQEGGLGVVMLKDHRLARKKAVTLVDLKEERFIVVPQGSISPGYGPLFALCQEVGFEPQIVQEVGTISSQLNLISVGMGIGLISTGRNFSYPSDLVVLPLNEVSYSTSFVFAWVKGENSPALDRMIEIIAALSK
jgi:DNA-binding transcriptional LysR family regulator